MYIPPKIEKIISEFNFDSWLNRPLTKQDKVLLCENLNLPSYSYQYCKWNTLKCYLEELKFEIKDTKRIVNGKQIRVSIIKKSM